jgi:hypothetical protein
MPQPTDELAPWVARLARIGYAAKALLYMTVGYLAAQAGLGRGGRVTDTEGALQVVQRSTGWVVVLLLAAGLLGYAVWRLIQAVLDPERRGSDVKAIIVRVGFALRALVYGALGITAVRLAMHQGTGSRGQFREWAESLFGLPGGELLVLLGGIWVVGYGVYQLYKAATPKMKRHLHLAELPDSLRRWILGVSRFGVAARGVVFCLIGSFLIRAAADRNPGQAAGMRESLRTIADMGRWPFLVIAFGLIAYGVYELLNARYRSIKVASTAPSF